MLPVNSLPQPWIRPAHYDGLLILAPPFMALLVVLMLPAPYRSTAQMPLLALPQSTHYVLDGFIWRRRK